MQCPYCETWYDGKLEPLPVILPPDVKGYQILVASVRIDDYEFMSNTEAAERIALDRLCAAMAKGLKPYMEIVSQKDPMSFSTILTGRIKVLPK